MTALALKQHLAKMTVYVFSAALLFSSAIFGFILLYPVDVITDWTITMPADNYQLGDEVILTSSYTKNLNVTGPKDGSHRYLECKPQGAAPIRYELNTAEPNRKAGIGSTGIVVKIPDTVPAITLPTECKFTIHIDYTVFGIRTVPEENSSKEFTLSAKAVTSSAEEPVAVSVPTDASVWAVTPPLGSSSSATAQAAPSPSNSTATVDPEPSIIDQLIAVPLQGIVNRINNVTKGGG